MLKEFVSDNENAILSTEMTTVLYYVHNSEKTNILLMWVIYVHLYSRNNTQTDCKYEAFTYQLCNMSTGKHLILSTYCTSAH